MIINTKIRYGLRTLLEIAMNKSSRGLLQKEISEKQEIPIKYLDQIISGLKSAGLIMNFAGKKSGYILVKHPSKINIYDIYRAFEPELAIVPCLNGNESENCDRDELCAAHIYWEKLNIQIESSMLGQTLEHLVNDQIQLNQQKDKVLSFEI